MGRRLLVVARAVPVLSEASVLFAGIGAVLVRRFFGLTALANAGISLVYATADAWALSGPTFLGAFAVSLALLGTALAASGRIARREEPAGTGRPA